MLLISESFPLFVYLKDASEITVPTNTSFLYYIFPCLFEEFLFYVPVCFMENLLFYPCDWLYQNLIKELYKLYLSETRLLLFSI